MIDTNMTGILDKILASQNLDYTVEDFRLGIEEIVSCQGEYILACRWLKRASIILKQVTEDSSAKEMDTARIALRKITEEIISKFT